MDRIAEQFDGFKRPGFFSRIDAKHILELHIGLDEKGRKAIELRASFTPVKVTGTSAIDVNQYRKDEYNTIRFSLKDDEMSGLFYKFCDDIIEQTRELKDPRDGYRAVTTRFFQWKKMFVLSRNTFLTEPEIMGLIGEILFQKIAIASCNSFQNSNNSKQSALAPGGRGEAPSGGSQRRAARGRRGAVAKVWVRRCRSGQAGGQRVLPGCCNPASSLADR